MALILPGGPHVVPGIVGFIGLSAALRDSDLLKTAAAVCALAGDARPTGATCRCQTGDGRCKTPANAVHSQSAHHDT
jgi:hypothetical protein